MSIDPEIKNHVANRFYTDRKKGGKTQEQFAETLGIVPRSYADLEHGKSMCSAMVLLRYLIYLGDEAKGFIDEFAELLKTLNKKA